MCIYIKNSRNVTTTIMCLDKKLTLCTLMQPKESNPSSSAALTSEYLYLSKLQISKNKTSHILSKSHLIIHTYVCLLHIHSYILL